MFLQDRLLGHLLGCRSTDCMSSNLGSKAPILRGTTILQVTSKENRLTIKWSLLTSEMLQCKTMLLKISAVSAVCADSLGRGVDGQLSSPPPP